MPLLVDELTDEVLCALTWLAENIDHWKMMIWWGWIQTVRHCCEAIGLPPGDDSYSMVSRCAEHILFRPPTEEELNG